MKEYRVTYITKNDTLGTRTLKAESLVYLSQLICDHITDMKDDDADNIIKIEEL